jgi:hypothetical protein
MLDTKVILNVIVALIVFRLLDKLLLSKVPMLSNFEKEEFEEFEEA